MRKFVFAILAIWTTNLFAGVTISKQGILKRLRK